MARLAAGLTQEDLADGLGVTFQQVQKYEKGTNRVGAGRLSDIARILAVPIPYFFEGVRGAGGPAKANQSMDEITEALSTLEGVRIARAIARIPNTNVRRRIAELLEAMIAWESRDAVA